MQAKLRRRPALLPDQPHQFGLADTLVLTVVEVFGFGWWDAPGVVVVDAPVVEPVDGSPEVRANAPMAPDQTLLCPPDRTRDARSREPATSGVTSWV